MMDQNDSWADRDGFDDGSNDPGLRELAEELLRRRWHRSATRWLHRGIILLIVLSWIAMLTTLLLWLSACEGQGGHSIATGLWFRCVL